MSRAAVRSGVLRARVRLSLMSPSPSCRMLLRAGHLATVAALIGLIGVTSCVPTSRAQEAGAASPAPGAPDAAGPAPSGTQAPKPVAKRAPSVRLTFRTVPPKKATVMWGKKRLGVIDPKTPLIVQRPRDSGPLDLVVRAEDCLPVHTRAYTFTDSTIAVKVTPVDQKNTVYGYREELPPEEEGAALPDASGAGGGATGGLPPAGFPSR